MVKRKEDQLDSTVKRDLAKRPSRFGDDRGNDQPGKVGIKLKIPKEEDEDEDEYKHNTMIGRRTNSWEEAEAEEEKSQLQQNQSKKNDDNDTVTVTKAYNCKKCEKKFMSGRALGGHARVHYQRSKDLNFTTQPSINKKLKKQEQRSDILVSKKPNYSYKSQTEDGLDHESLSGHLRTCHPDRKWRGTQPPNPPSVHCKVDGPSSNVSDLDQPQSSSSGDDMHSVDDQEKGYKRKGDETDDLSKSAWSWTVTGKRGSKSIYDIKGKERADEDDDVEERNVAASLLLSFSCGDTSEASNQKVLKEDFETANSKYEETNRRAVAVDDSKKKGRRERYDHPAEELNRNEYYSKKKKSDQRSGIWIGTGMIEDHKGHVKKDVQGTSLSDGRKKLETNINRHNESATEKKDLWGDEDTDDSEKTRDNQQLMDLQYLKHSDSITSIRNSITGVKNKKKEMKLRDPESAHHHDYDHDLSTPSTAALTVQAKGNSSSGDKVFSTHQAHGGNTSGHNKSRMLIENALDHDDSTTAADEHDDDVNLEDNENPDLARIKKLSGDERHEEGEGINSSNSKRQVVAEENAGGGEQDHLCKICNKTFPSGQALGDHKRCQGININATGVQVASSAGLEEAAVSHSDHPKVLEFDLNEKPPM